MDILQVLKDNNEEEIKKYLFQYGKAPKPAAPFYFINKEELKDGRDAIDGRINEANSGDHTETEITE